MAYALNSAVQQKLHSVSVNFWGWTMNSLQHAARQLHKCGFKTLPIQPGSKIPATAHGVKDAVLDDGATDAYYGATDKGSHGIGISGEGFIIFDLDCHGDVDGRETLLEWEREHGELPDTHGWCVPIEV